MQPAKKAHTKVWKALMAESLAARFKFGALILRALPNAATHKTAPIERRERDCE